MNGLYLFAVPLLVLAVHTFALIVSRRGASRLHALSFYSGLFGLLSVPTGVLAVIYSLPMPVVGPLNPRFDAAAGIIAALAIVLVLTSMAFGIGAAAKRQHRAA